MIMRRIVPLVFLLFTTYTAWVLATYPQNFFVWFLELVTDWASLQVVLDLSLSLLLLWQFIYWDHKARGGTRGPVLVFFLLTFFMGVIAPLAFLTLRTLRPQLFYPDGVRADVPAPVRHAHG